MSERQKQWKEHVICYCLGEPACKIPSNVCPVSTKQVPALTVRPSSQRGLQTSICALKPGSNQVCLPLTQHQVTVTQHRPQLFLLLWSCHPAPTLFPFSIPVLITGSLFCHQTLVLFSPISSGDTVPESWSQDKDFPFWAFFFFLIESTCLHFVNPTLFPNPSSFPFPPSIHILPV